MKTTFKVDTTEINKVLKEFQKLNKRFFEKGIAKIRVMPGGIELSGEGIIKYIHGETEGLSEIFIPIKLLYTYSSTSKATEITFTIWDGELMCGSSIFTLPSIKVETWYNSSDLDLSINSNDYEILKENFFKGDDFMKKHNHLDKVEIAKKKMEISIDQAYHSLEKYRISRDDIYNLIINQFKAV
jgi:hypothetical protein